MAQTWVRSIANTCGESEQEAKSRRYNVIEPFVVMTFCLVVLWEFQYPFGVLRKIEAVNTCSGVLLFFGALYVLFVSPFIHRDTLTSWGLGNPVALLRGIRSGPLSRRIAMAGAILAVVIGLTCAFYINWVKAADFLFKMKEQSAADFQQMPAGKPLIVLMGIVLSMFFATCVIRYDNFLSALFTAVKVVLVLGTLLYLTAWMAVGAKAFADFKPSKFSLDVFGYIFWGALQQLLFSSYFGTRLRKGFAPAADPADQTKKRLAVAVLNGAFFGLIHINSWALVGFTWILGCILSWVFMQDKNRNLIALGFIHGFLGSSVGWLFDSDKAGRAAVSMGVGPTHMKGFDLFTVVVTISLIAGFVTFIVYAYQNWRED